MYGVIRITTFLFLFAVLRTPVLSAQTNYKKLSDTNFTTGDRIITPDILFPMHGAPRDYPVFRDSVGRIAEFLSKHPALKIELGGHTDSRGAAESNKSLSYLRVRYVKDYLVTAYRIDSARVQARGYGESAVLFSDSLIQLRKTRQEQEELHQRNRRMEIKILSTD